MADITYPNRNTASGLAKPDVAAVRFVEFEVDFSKITAVGTDNVLLGTIPKGSVVFAGTAQVLTAGGTAATCTLKVGSTSVAAALTCNATAGTVYANAVTSGGPIVTTADAVVQVTIGGTGLTASGKQRFVLIVSEAVKDTTPKLAVRDQTTGTA